METCSSALLFMLLAPCAIVGNPSEKRVLDTAIPFPPSPRERRSELGQPARDAYGEPIYCSGAVDEKECPYGYKCQPETFYFKQKCCPVEKDDPGFCPVGQPVRDEKGTVYACGRSPEHRECPKGTSCRISPIDAFAVCCQDMKCLNGEPPTDENGEQYFCGKDEGQRDCPEGTKCQRSADGFYTICCKKDKEPFQCPTGKPAVNEKGVPIICHNDEISARVCPKGTQCSNSPDGTYGMCCGNEQRKCEIGEPIQDEKGVEYFCGRGPAHRECPEGTQCHISPVDAYAVCCKQEEPVRICPIGKPMVDDNGDQYRCDPSANGWDCPYNGLCVTTPEGYGVCCPPDKTARRCLLGGPLTDADGVEYFCGKAPCHRNCPKGYRCDISTRDGSAVCCVEDIIEFPPPLEQ